MQIVDIKITPPTQTDPLSRVCFIGDGGEEVAVTIANHREGGATIDQELVAKAKVMLLHAAAAQIRDRDDVAPEPAPASRGAEDDEGGLRSLGEDQDVASHDSDEPDTVDGAETEIAPHMDRASERAGE